MKVALIHYRYGPGGGMDAYFADLARGFSEAGDQVDYWTYEHSPEFLPPKNVSMRVVPLKSPKPFRKIAFHTQIVGDLDPDAYDLVIGAMRTSKQDIHVNGGVHLAFSKEVNGGFRITDVIPTFFEWRAFKNARVIVAHSGKVADEMKRYYGLPPEKIRTVYPPVNGERFNQDVRRRRAELRAKYGIDAGKTTLLFPSTNHKIKGLDLLLSAFSKLPEGEFELLIAGVPMDSGKVPPNVRFLGYIQAMEELYAASDFTVLPSHYDAFGLVIVESLACGTPVIVSKNSGVSEIVKPEHGIVLGGESFEELAQAIITARSRTFQIGNDYLEKQGLTVAQHIEAIRKIASDLR